MVLQSRFHVADSVLNISINTAKLLSYPLFAVAHFFDRN